VNLADVFLLSKEDYAHKIRYRSARTSNLKWLLESILIQFYYSTEKLGDRFGGNILQIENEKQARTVHYSSTEIMAMRIFSFFSLAIINYELHGVYP